MQPYDDLLECWDVRPPVRPPHSWFYSLPPIGVGTAGVESLTSYIMRLAAAHSVSPQVLMRQGMQPIWDSLGDAPPAPVAPNIHNLRERGSSLNSTMATARAWVEWLQILTSQSNLHSLTMLMWGAVVSVRYLLRSQQAWCAQCYEEWRATGQAVYQPLQWSLVVVQGCLRHHRRLQERCPCPDCNRPLPVLASRSQIGYCPFCYHWLGTDLSDSAGDLDWVTEAHIEEQTGALLAQAAHLPAPPARDQVAKVIGMVCHTQMPGGYKQMARYLHSNRTCVLEWDRGTQIPQLGVWIRLAGMLNTSLPTLLTADEVLPPPTLTPAPQIALAPRLNTPRPTDQDALQAALRMALDPSGDPPPSLRQVATRLNYDPSFLRRHCPDLTTAICAQFRAYQVEQRAARIARMRQQIQTAMHELHAAGVYPSRQQVATRLGFDRIRLREPELNATWRETLRELGLGL